MPEIANHYCPGCGTSLKPFLRYPWYFCGDCVDMAVDHAGRKLHFGNASMSGGFTWRIDGQDTTYSSYGVLCLINNRPVFVGEARFGGVAAEPWVNERRQEDRMADLRRRDPDFSKYEMRKPGGVGKGR